MSAYPSSPGSPMSLTRMSGCHCSTCSNASSAEPAAITGAFGAYDAAVKLDDVPHDGKSQAEAAMAAADRGLSLPEAVEHEREELGANSLSCIAHRDSRQRVGRLQPDIYAATRGREL